MCIKNVRNDNLICKVYETREEMGKAAAKEIAEKIKELLHEKESINMLFAAAPSQNELLKYLTKEDVEWSKINAFHMDEYIGLNEGSQKSFAYYLKKNIFDNVPLKSVNYIGCGDIDKICETYSKLINENPIDIVCCGIGENAHLAFNDPGVADFNDKEIIKPVKLDEICRQQQVNDKTFDILDDVPKFAVTLTIPTMFSAKYMYCIVPTGKKANAVRDTMYAEISEAVPATIMRKHAHAIMYTDKESAKLL